MDPALVYGDGKGIGRPVPCVWEERGAWLDLMSLCVGGKEARSWLTYISCVWD